MEHVTGVASLGLDWKLFIAQIVNFLILWWLLKMFAYQPVLKVLENRRKMIEKSTATAKEIDRREQKLQEKIDRQLRQANQRASLIIDEAKQSAELVKQQLLKEIHQERDRDKQRLAAEFQLIKTEMLNEAKKELAQLVIAASTRVIGKAMSAKINNQLITEVTEGDQ